jgi:hypothetical protein
VNLKTIESINKLKDISLEFDRLKNELEMMHIAYNAKKEWVGLTDEELGELYHAGWSTNMDFARRLQQILKEKNSA